MSRRRSSFEKRMDDIPIEARPTKKEYAVWTAMFIILFLFTSGIFSVFKDDPDAAFAGSIYSLFLITSAVIGGLFLAFYIMKNIEKSPFIFWAPFTNGRKRFLLSNRIWAGLAGVGMTVPFLLGAQAIGIPQFLLQLSVWQVALFVVFIAPFSEEFMFRCSCFPTLRKNFNRLAGAPWGTVLAFLVINFAWGLFHFSVLGANFLTTLFVFGIGIIYTAGNIIFKDTGFSLTAHFTNNLGVFIITMGVLG